MCYTQTVLSQICLTHSCQEARQDDKCTDFKNFEFLPFPAQSRHKQQTVGTGEMEQCFCLFYTIHTKIKN